MAKKNSLKTSNENAIEHIFCMINERELFTLCQSLIEDPVTQSASAFQDLHFRVTGYNMLNILIEHVQRSQVQENQDAYFALTRDKLTSASGAEALPVQI